jgi:hypothetical protein
MDRQTFIIKNLLVKDGWLKMVQKKWCIPMLHWGAIFTHWLNFAFLLNGQLCLFNLSTCAAPRLVSYIGVRPSIHYGGVSSDVKPYSSQSPLEQNRDSQGGGVRVWRKLWDGMVSERMQLKSQLSEEILSLCARDSLALRRWCNIRACLSFLCRSVFICQQGVYNCVCVSLCLLYFF